jgi:hypothetical protein
LHDAENDAAATEKTILEALRHVQDIIPQPEVEGTLPSRVLHDAYHFMDRLLHLLSKKHSAFNEFARQFSETLFIRDKDDEVNVRRALEAKNIQWEYAIWTMKTALNRRIRRYIPPPERLAADLEILFSSFQDIQDSVD